jgi:hypothetical protein
MLTAAMASTEQALRFNGTDLEVRAEVVGETISIGVFKSGACVHRVKVEDMPGTLENSWIAGFFAREDRIQIGAMNCEMVDYLDSLDINQG